MKAAIAAFLMLGTAGAAHAVESPARDVTDPKSVVSARGAESAPVPIADLYYTRGGMGAVWSHDGKDVVLSSNLTGRYNLWKVGSGGGWPLQLTQSDDRQSGLAGSPDGKWVVYESDHGGNEMYDLFVIPVAGGGPVNLTQTSGASEMDPLFSPDGSMLVFDQKQKTAPAPDIAVMDFATRKVRQLTHETESHVWRPVAWVNGGRQVIANRINPGQTQASVWRIDVQTGKAEELTPSKGDVINEASDATPDGRWVAVTSDAKDGHRQLALLDTTTGQSRWIAQDVWEQSGGHFSPDGKSLVVRTNADSRINLSLYDIASGQMRPLALPPGVNREASGGQTSFSPDSRHLLVAHEASNTPFDYWVVDVDGGQPQRLTDLGFASINPDKLPTSQIVHYRSKDGTVISALLWLPFNLKRDGSAPAIVLPHGGPTGQTLDSFNRTAIALASRGYICIAPNVRGSTGYGKEFQLSNLKDLGGADLLDEVYASKFLIDSGYADAKKIGITGGSYGGYMTLMAVTKTPDVWAAGVEMYGIIDWATMLEHEDARLRAYEMALIGDPVKDKAVYAATSPITYLKQEKAPLLVLQGDNDIRVPKGQAETVVSGLKAMGNTVDVHYYANEGHGFAKRENQIDSLERTVAWFNRYLKGAQ
jgi:dipeptidyl aminopeptidase/acylaminoacyl peptidase